MTNALPDRGTYLGSDAKVTGSVALGRPALALALADLTERLVARIARKRSATGLPAARSDSTS